MKKLIEQLFTLLDLCALTDGDKHIITKLVNNAVQQWAVIGAGGGKINIAFFSEEDAARTVFERWKAENETNPAVKVHLMAVIEGWVPITN